MVAGDPADTLLAQRLASQLLSGTPADDTAGVADRLLAVQAQDQRAARLAIRVRSRVRSAAGVDHALTEDRSVVVTWLGWMRRSGPGARHPRWPPWSWLRPRRVP